MTDRELLELAAKAAGKEGYTWESNPFTEALIKRNFDEQGFEVQAQYWNPLTDDGDALRLAVQLGIDFNLSSDTCVEVMWFDANIDLHSITEPIAGGKLAETRRAIVRAAAEIGGAK